MSADDRLFATALEASVAVKLCECGCGRPAPIASGTDQRRGRVKGQPLRFVHGHRMPVSLAERLAAKVELATDLSPNGMAGCVVLKRPSMPDGYGRIQVDGKTAMTHIAAWRLAGNEIPAGYQLDHLCRRTACVNPAHLEPVTPAENVRRSSIAKLTAEAAAAIRVDPGGNAEVCQRYGVSECTVRQLRAGRTWKDIPVETDALDRLKAEVRESARNALLNDLYDKLSEMQLHDRTGDPFDNGYKACWLEVRTWMVSQGLDHDAENGTT